MAGRSHDVPVSDAAMSDATVSDAAVSGAAVSGAAVSDVTALDATVIAVELMTAMTRLRARLRSESSPSDMHWSWSQLAALGRIVRDGPTTTSDLAQAEHVRRQSMAETVAVLRADGLLEAQPDPTDGRKMLLVATKQGRDLMERIPAAREAWLSVAMDAMLGHDEQQILHEAAAIMGRLADGDT